MTIFLIIISLVLCGFLIYTYSLSNQEKIKAKKFEEQLNVALKQQAICQKNYEQQKFLSAGYEHTIELLRQNIIEEYTSEEAKLQQELETLKYELENTNQLYDQAFHRLQETEMKADAVQCQMEARVAALQREQKIKDNLSDYCLQVSNADLQDIETLEKIKSKLNKPRILCMLIWQTYFQKQLTTLSNKILGSKVVCGIYKITNQLDNQCYIGQSTNIKDRWADHVKCGLGIDTPAGNKLYDAMQRDGVWNFSFELLEECSRDMLNQKEREYISIYDSYNLGYNSTSGNKTINLIIRK